ncbi:MAG: TVP38/TMEM64 family protein [Candidatus Nanosalina sp.]
MERPEIFESSEKEFRAAKTTLLFLAVTVIIVWFLIPYRDLLLDVEAMRSFIDSYGVLAPLVLIMIQTGQVIIAPIPGPVVGAAAGYAFGVFWGTVYGFIGLSVGSAFAVLSAKKWGRPFVEDILADQTLEKFDSITESHGFLPFFLLFLLPGFPDDAICFIAGLTELDTRKLIVYASLGRLPGLLSLTVFGNGLAFGNLWVMTVTGVAVIIVSLAAYSYREKVYSPDREVEVL